LHQLIHALRIVKKTFPEIKLYVPGDLSGKRSSILFTLPYVNYLNKTIAEYNLVDNVEFCGKLSSQQMAEKMLSSSAFVMPSAIENHSSTLREAMHLGCPCISALVGGTHEFTQHGENSLTYRYEEFEVLAANIVKVLGDRQLAEKIGARARETINEKYPQNSIGAVGIEIYQDILRRKKAMSTGS
jgi:glycosyltransferase involved in cell wall biosynthesis